MPTVRRRPDAQDNRGQEPEREPSSPRVSMSMPRALGPMREPQPTAEFAPEELAEALERLRSIEEEAAPAPPEEPVRAPRAAMPPRRTRSGERAVVRAPMPTPPVDLPRDVLVGLEPEDPSGVAERAEPTPAPPAPAPERPRPVTGSASALGAAVHTMEMTPRAPTTRTSASPRVSTRTTPDAITPTGSLPAVTPLDPTIPLTRILAAKASRLEPVGAAVPRLRTRRGARPAFLFALLVVLALAAVFARVELHLF